MFNPRWVPFTRRCGSISDADYQTGTMGYIAPFTKTASGQWDASRSWCPKADRYALAVLVVELLLIGAGRTPSREDGSLFAQGDLENLGSAVIREQTEALLKLDRRAGLLFRNTVRTSSFDDCPAPGQWKGLLRSMLHTRPPVPGTTPERSRRSIRTCSSCGTETQVADAWYAELQSRGLPFLCKACRNARSKESAARRLQRDHTHPAVTCEHCRRPTRVHRGKLDALRARGSPILCPSCLPGQLDRWKREQGEWERARPQATCAQCETRFRIRKDKHDLLIAAGRPLLCWDCLKSH